MHNIQQVWEKNIKKLKAYHKKHGNFYVPPQGKEDPTFFRWVTNVRKQGKKLPAKLFTKLEKIGFFYHAVPGWDVMFSRLVAFYEKNGHSFIPPNEPKFERLFDWTVNLRLSKSRLPTKQIKDLESLDFEWTLLVNDEFRWDEMYRELVTYKKKFGHVKVPQYYKENATLGKWVSSQRRSKTSNTLRADRVKRLNAIGFLWKEDIARMINDAWEKRYKELVAYKKANGHIDRIKVTHDQYQLGLWMRTQIVHQNTLPAERKKKLNAIGFKWDKGDFHGDLWNKMYERLKAFKEKHGHCRVQKSDDFQLLTWIRSNKGHKNIIRPEWRKKLERIGVDLEYNIKEELEKSWNAMYKRYQNFVKKHGHTIGTSSKHGPQSTRQLYQWLRGQMELKKENKLNKKREMLLVKVKPLWHLSNFEARWFNKLQEFIDFKKKNKGQYIPWNTPLRTWLYNQKIDFNTLPAEKKKLLLKAGVIQYLKKAGTLHDPYRGSVK